MASNAEISSKEIKHGTAGGYSYGKCRCELCTAAQAAYMREYRKGDFARKKSRLWNRRAVYQHKLAANWVKKNHPDVWAQIIEEAASVYSESLYLKKVGNIDEPSS